MDKANKGKTLGIISASGCNLNCVYCYLHSNGAYHEEDKKIIEAMKNGEFFFNIKRTLRHLEVKPEDFTRLELWGAETSLHLSETKEFYIELFKFFPNITEVAYSSNFMTNIQNHLDFIQIIETYSQYKGMINFELQISIDGPDEISLQTRHYKYELLRAKVDAFIDALNKTKLKKTRLQINYKPTLPWKIYSSICEDNNKIIEFLNFFCDEEKSIRERIINQMVFFNVGSCFGPALEYPYAYTVEDGLKMAYYAKKFTNLNLQTFYERPVNLPFLSCGLVEDNLYDLYNSNGACGQMLGNFLFRHNGSLCACSNGFLDLEEKNREELIKKGESGEADKILNTIRMSPKIGPDGRVDLEDLTKKVNYMKVFWQYHWHATISVVCALMWELAWAGQISPVYKENPDLIYRHALIVINKAACYFNNLRETGVAYAPNSGLIKLFCNGLIEVYESNALMEKI